MCVYMVHVSMRGCIEKQVRSDLRNADNSFIHMWCAAAGGGVGGVFITIFLLPVKTATTGS